MHKWRNSIPLFIMPMPCKPYSNLCSTAFSHLLWTHGWSQAQTLFAMTGRRHHPHSYARPHITGEHMILIPYFVNGNHWVAVAGREVNGQATFWYSDDLNCQHRENWVHQELRNASTEFYPTTARWIKCHCTTYQPHSNECGPCTLLALTIWPYTPPHHLQCSCL